MKAKDERDVVAVNVTMTPHEADVLASVLSDAVQFGTKPTGEGAKVVWGLACALRLARTYGQGTSESVPATVDGSDAPAINSYVEGCCCAHCNPWSNRMIVCSTCGNKRCPHASDHRFACTGSNEPGQAGSLYRDLARS